MMLTLSLPFALDRFGRAWPLRATGLGRALGWFWLAVLASLSVLAVLLTLLGPPMPRVRGFPAYVRPEAGPSTVGTSTVVPSTGGPVAGAEGRKPMQAYAAPFDRSDNRPRIGLLLAGIGLSGADSEAAIRTLPGEVSLAFSPYAHQPEALLAAARGRGHELLVSLPLEPAGAPQHDAGNKALLLGANTEQNLRRLEWSLSQIEGYVGATGALGALRGERFASSGVAMRSVTQVLAARGLLYVDPRPGERLPDGVRGRVVDLVVDDVQELAPIERQLRELERLARRNGAALGLVGAPVPTTIGGIAAWAAGLAERGFALAPVTALLGDAPASSAAPTPTEHAQ